MSGFRWYSRYYPDTETNTPVLDGLRRPEPIYMHVGYVSESSFSETI